jgi:hypothetical protein
VLIQVKNKHERSSPVRPPGVEKTSRLGSRDLVASGVKCGPHGGKDGKMKSWTVSWLSLKPRPKTRRRGAATQAGSTTQDGRSDSLGRSNCPGGRPDRPDHCRREASKRMTCVGIARLASRLSRLRSLGLHPMENIRRLPIRP